MAYKDFKSYIQDKYYDLLTAAIKEYVDNHHDGIGFHDFNVLSLLKQKIENVEVKSLVCHEAGIGDLLRIEARTAADIVEMSLGTKEIEAGRKTRWFIVHLTAELNQGLHDVKVQKTEENYFGSFDLEGALDAYWSHIYAPPILRTWLMNSSISIAMMRSLIDGYFRILM